MLSLIRPAVVLFLLLTLVTGVIYPALVTAISKIAFSRQAAGSFITMDGKEIGSELIAQPFSDPRYFWPRPSAAGYDATASAGSNLGPANPALVDAVKGRIDTLRGADPANTAAVPIDLVTASASGLDPQISLAAAQYQVARIARARGLAADAVQRLIDAAAEPSTLRVFGDPKVNVLRLNLMLDHPGQADGITAGAMSDMTGLRGRGFAPESN